MKASSPVLVGRDPEVARLIDAYGRAKNGQPQTLLIQGDAGVGKSRLVSEFLDRVRMGQGVVALGRCADVEGGLPFGPIAEGFRDLIDQLESDALPEQFAALAPILPELGDQADPSAFRSRAHLFNGMVRSLASFERPVAFVIEDAHWSDRSTRDSVKFMVDRLKDEPVILIVTIRSDEPAPAPGMQTWVGELKRSASVSALDLQPLDREGASRQIEEIRGVSPDPDLVDAIYRRSQGNPFFTEELLAAGVDTNVAALPSLADVFLGNVELLDEAARDVLRALAVSEAGASSDQLADALDTDPQGIARALRAALDARLVVREEEDRYRFRHALLRELLYEELTAFERRRFHGGLARTLAASSDTRDAPALSQLAYHWLEASELARARKAFIEAGDAALVGLAYAESADHFVAAAKLGEQLGDEEPASDVLLEKAAQACGFAGEWERAAGLLDSAVQVAEATAQPERIGHLMERLGFARWWAFRDPSVELLEQALELQPRERPTSLRARLLRRYAFVLGETGCAHERLALLNEEAVEVAIAAGDPLEEGRARVQWGTTLSPEMLVDMAPVLDGLSLIKRHGTPDEILDASARVGDALLYLGDLRGLDQVMGEAVALATELQVHSSWPAVHAVYANALFYLGRWDEVDELDRQVQEEGSPTRPDLVRRLATAAIRIGQGRFGEVEAMLAEVAELLADSASVLDQANIALAEGSYFLWLGELAKASAQIREGVALTHTQNDVPNAQELFLLGLQIEASRVASGVGGGEPTQLAASYIEGARRVAREGQDRLSEVILDWSEAEYARAQKRNDPVLWERVAVRSAELEIPWFEAWARWRQAEALLAAGAARSTATEVLHRAHELASGLGARPLLIEIRGLAKRARIEIPEPDRESEAGEDGMGESPIERYGLTPRELEVLRLVSVGKTNPEIAAELFISAKTASVHVSHILEKLGVSRRIEAAGMAHAWGSFRQK